MSTQKRFLPVLTCFFTAALLCLATASSAAEAPAIEPRVDQILKAAADYLKDAREFAVHAEFTVDNILPTGQKIQHAASWDAATKKPNKLRTWYRGDLRNSGVWYDGKTFTMLNKDSNFYAVWPAPSKLDGLLDKLEEKLGMRVPLSSLFSSDPYKLWREGIERGTYIGLHLVGGTPCHHLLLTQKDVDVQVWIEEGRQLVPRKVVFTFKNEPQSPQFTAVLSGWDFNPRLSDLLFTFVPPAGASKIDFIQAGE